MQTQPIRPARIVLDEHGTVHAPDFGDVYHAAAGALAQAEHVFLQGNGLPTRWQGRERFVVLETGFGLGHNFLATWQAWRRDAARCERLCFVSVEAHPLTRDDLRAVHARLHAGTEVGRLAHELAAQWPVLTPNLHLLDFEGGRVQLILALGEAGRLLREMQLQADAVYLDGFAPDRNPAMWSADVLRQVARLCAPGATAATWSAARAVRDELARQGFEVTRRAGFAAKRDMTVAAYAPRFVPPAPAAFRPAHNGPREALVIGAGLAGCAAAWALSRQGWCSTVIDRHAQPAQETSGNAGGLLHAPLNLPDSVHARWFRAGALHTARWAAEAVQAGRVPGQLDGLLRLDAALHDKAAAAALQQRLAEAGLDGAVQAWTRNQACTRAGLNLPSGAWWTPQGGWLSPGGWARELLHQAGNHTTLRQARVHRLVRNEAGLWQAWDVTGCCVGEAPVLVLAHAGSAATLWPAGLPCPPLTAVRGQTTLCPADHPLSLAAAGRPAVPVSGHGYALRLPDGALLLGATTQPGDDGADPRPGDHRHNLQRAAELGLWPSDAVATLDEQALSALGGRVGWRALTRDRLPVVGPVPGPDHSPAPRSAALRAQPRAHDAQGGVYVLNGLASRGLASAALAARLLAAWVSGAPQPVENDLRDALDPARFTGRR